MGFTDEQIRSLAYNPEAATSTQLLARELMELKANPRDAFHTMDDLYDQRMLWNAVAVRMLDEAYPGSVCKSWNHHDYLPCFGKTEVGDRWFIVTIMLPDDGGQVSQHYPERDWELFNVIAVPAAPHWDGHTPEVADKRLRDFLLKP